MTTIKLTYFDFPGGRGETTRLALSIGGVAFVDERVKHPDWSAMKPTTPFGGLPVLEVDGRRISQANAINRYVGRLTKLYPGDAWTAAECDEVCDAVEALNNELARSFALSGDEQKAERLRLLEGPIPRYLKAFAALLERRGGEWFAGGAMTIADLKVLEIVRMLGAGRLDHIPKDVVDRLAPALAAHRDRVLAHPAVRAYQEKLAR